jgi:hypothetical protein
VLADDEMGRSVVGGGGHDLRFDDTQWRSDGDPTVQERMWCCECEICPERPPDEANGCIWASLGGQVDSSQDVEALPVAVVVTPVGTLNASEIEPKRRYAELRERPEETIDDRGMHVATVQWVWMAEHHRRERWLALVGTRSFGRSG